MARKTRKNTKASGLARRRRAAMRRAAAAKVDAVLVSRAEDVAWLSGFTGHDSVLLVGEGWARLITDSRYGEQAVGECPDVDVHVRGGSMGESIAESLKGRRVRRLGVQEEVTTLAFHKTLSSQMPTKRIKPVKALTGPLRAIKDDGEVRAIRRAIGVGERAFREVVAMGAKAWAGRCERELAAELDYRMRLGGADGPAFDTIVAAGANASRPHHRPGTARIRHGSAVLIDWGANVGGYCSDLTRVVFLGKISPKWKRMYEAVRRAQAAAIATARAGVSGKAVDAAARRELDRVGLGEKFTHGLGHGLGRQVHEAPGLGRKATGRLRAGMVVTIEPGVYEPGFGGVRIEDDILITRGGCRRLSTLSRNVAAMML